MELLYRQVQRTERLTNETADVLHDDRFWLADLFLGVLAMIGLD